jgi:hypothetical protein
MKREILRYETINQNQYQDCDFKIIPILANNLVGDHKKKTRWYVFNKDYLIVSQALLRKKWP